MPKSPSRERRRIFPERGPQPTTPTYPRPLFVLSQLYEEMVRRLDRHMQPAGMTWALARIFNAIATRPYISSAQLAKMFGIAPQSVKQSVTTLEQRGWIERIPSESDNRVLQTVLTEKGEQKRREQNEAIAIMYAEVFENISQEDVDTLVRIAVDTLQHIRPESLDYFTDLDQRMQIDRTANLRTPKI